MSDEPSDRLWKSLIRRLVIPAILIAASIFLSTWLGWFAQAARE
jgi:hypothetical protein